MLFAGAKKSFSLSLLFNVAPFICILISFRVRTSHEQEPFSYHKTMILKEALAQTVERESPAPSPKSPSQIATMAASSHISNPAYVSALANGNTRASVTQGYVPFKQSNFNDRMLELWLVVCLFSLSYLFKLALISLQYLSFSFFL
jgi:hypothetical protein